MKPLSQRIEDFANILESSIVAATNEIDVPIIIMGPALNQTKPSPAAILRTELLTRCTSIGTSVYPEHKGLTRIAKRRFGAGHDLATYERFLAEQSDLVVIIPSSPGSFCELGYFSMIQEICVKTIIFLDRNFQKSKSYIMDGPVSSARNKRAHIKRIDYSNIDGAWKVVKSEIEKIRSTRAIQKISGR